MKLFRTKMISIMLLSAVLLSSCGPATAAATAKENTEPSAETASVQDAETPDTNTVVTEENTTAADASDTSAAAVQNLSGIYAMPTYDTVPEELLEWHDDVDYGTIDENVEYYSTTAGDIKYCNVLLPAGYDE
jgi:PBP1b-binding outer membrane lipoprotein LpoB